MTRSKLADEVGTVLFVDHRRNKSTGHRSNESLAHKVSLKTYASVLHEATYFTIVVNKRVFGTLSSDVGELLSEIARSTADDDEVSTQVWSRLGQGVASIVWNSHIRAEGVDRESGPLEGLETGITDRSAQ